jgi:hypothetical protein
MPFTEEPAHRRHQNSQQPAPFGVRSFVPKWRAAADEGTIVSIWRYDGVRDRARLFPQFFATLR